MRISTHQLYQLGVSAILDNQAKLSKTELQLATGRRLVTPSDDPSTSGRLLDLESVLRQTERYQQNSKVAQSRLELQENTLANATNVMQSVRELVVRGLNDTVSDTDRDAIAQEIRQRLDELLALANTQDSTGEYIFSGYYAGTTDPFVDGGSGTYTYGGDQGQRSVEIGPGREVAVNDHGQDVFMNIAASGGGVQSAFKALYDTAVAMESNAPVGSALTDIDAAMNNFLEFRAKAGSRIKAIESQIGINDSVKLQIEQTKSTLGDVDYAEAVSRMNQELLALQASQQAFVRFQNLSLFNFLG
jgi:flagellar hook-associated protein 3 FlgL